MPSTAASSDAPASQIFFIDPKCVNSARRRAGPTPSSSSSREASVRFCLNFR